MKEITSQDTKYWVDHYKSWRVSGLIQKEYCKQHNIRFDHFRKCRSQLIKSGEITSTGIKGKPISFKPITTDMINIKKQECCLPQHPPEKHTEIELSLPGGVQLTLRCYQ